METQTKPLLINLVYRSPNSSAENNAQLDEFIKLATSTSVTLGDMNYRGIDWENGCSDSEGRNFFNATQDAFLQHHVDKHRHQNRRKAPPCFLDRILPPSILPLAVERLESD